MKFMTASSVMGLCAIGLLVSAGAAKAQENSSPDLDLQVVPDSQTAPALQAAQANTGQFVVLFGFDQATLDPEGMAVVSAAAEEFQRSGSARISVRGHTDTSGSSAYNQELSERREQAVANELMALGVPATAITSDAVGETDLAVPTPDGVKEAANRRVEITVDRPPEPVAVAPAPEPAPPPPAPAAPPPEPKKERIFSVGGFYGYNFEDLVNDESQMAGINLAVDKPLLPWLSAGVEQAGFYHFDTPNDGFGGRTVGSLDLTMGDDDLRGHVGGNIGYLYASGIDDDFIAGPEIGLAGGPMMAKIAYDIPFNQNLDEGIINTTIGFRF